MEEVLPLTHAHGGCWNFAHTLYHIRCKARGIPSIIDGPDNFNYEAYDIASDSLVTVYRVLNSFIDVLHPNKLPFYKDGYFGIYDPSSDREAKSGEEKFHEDKYLLMHIITEQLFIARIVTEYPVEDEFLRGMKELDSTREVPFYLAFAAQVHLDIHHELREDATKASEYLLRISELLHDDIQITLIFMRSSNPKVGRLRAATVCDRYRRRYAGCSRIRFI